MPTSNCYWGRGWKRRSKHPSFSEAWYWSWIIDTSKRKRSSSAIHWVIGWLLYLVANFLHKGSHWIIEGSFVTFIQHKLHSVFILHIVPITVHSVMLRILLQITHEFGKKCRNVSQKLVRKNGLFFPTKPSQSVSSLLHEIEAIET